MTRAGVLGIQGDVEEHEAALRRLGAETRRVARPGDLVGLNALVLPGGESTTISLLSRELGLDEAIRRFITSGAPVWGTCAGVILLAETVRGGERLIGGLAVEVERNAFGRQVDSFEADITIGQLDPPAFRGVFIRAPAIRAVGPEVEVLGRLDDGTVVAVRQGNVMGTVFHPELTRDDRLHRLFLQPLSEPGRAHGVADG